MVGVKLSTFAVRSPRRFGDCWAATQLGDDLGLHTFWRDALADDAGDVPWDKVLALLVHKPALEQHLAAKCKDLFGATFDLLLYDRTSTY